MVGQSEEVRFFFKWAFKVLQQPPLNSYPFSFFSLHMSISYVCSPIDSPRALTNQDLFALSSSLIFLVSFWLTLLVFPASNGDKRITCRLLDNWKCHTTVSAFYVIVAEKNQPVLSSRGARANPRPDRGDSKAATCHTSRHYKKNGEFFFQCKSPASLFLIRAYSTKSLLGKSNKVRRSL